MILYNAPSSYYSMIARYALLEAGIAFENRRMDIHLAKEQLKPWYQIINPKMTVPSLVDGMHIWTDSQDIVKHVASEVGAQWFDADKELGIYIEQLVYAHYQLTIERLTFGKAMLSIPPLRVIFPHILRKIIKQLEGELADNEQRAAVEAKIAVNTQRLNYFTAGDLREKLAFERLSVVDFLEKLPKPQQFLFGQQLSSADIVTVVLLGRLKMIGEYDLVKSEELKTWFCSMSARQAYKKADIWTTFRPWRILLKY